MRIFLFTFLSPIQTMSTSQIQRKKDSNPAKVVFNSTNIFLFMITNDGLFFFFSFSMSINQSDPKPMHTIVRMSFRVHFVNVDLSTEFWSNED